jgi:hypothetical protein
LSSKTSTPAAARPGWGGNPQTFDGLTGVTGLVIGRPKSAGEAQGAVDVDGIEIVCEPQRRVDTVRMH